MSMAAFDKVLERLSQHLINENESLSVGEDAALGSLLQELELAQSFVKRKREASTSTSHVFETGVEQMIQILPQVEHCLDSLFEEPTFFQKLKLACTSDHILRRMAAMDKVTQVTEALRTALESLGPSLQQIPRERLIQRTVSLPRVNTDVGFEEDEKALLAKLVGKEDDDPATILAIVGMSGSGKTTLAVRLYIHETVRAHFNRRAWLYIPGKLDASRESQVLRELCLGLQVPFSNQEETSAVVFKLRGFLQSNSCLVVLDDVSNKETLQALLPLVLSSQNSRVLITTRNKGILLFPGISKIYIHEGLSLTPDESWLLFSGIVSNNWQGPGSFDAEGELAMLGKEIIQACNGIPLPVVVLAGILSTKSTKEEWETLKNGVRSMIQIKDIHDTLELSYFDLPYQLKPCFLYLGIYPEDSSIDVDELTQLWIGEGILRSNLCDEGQTLEELAIEFLQQLALRSFVQVDDAGCGEEFVSVRVHDLLRDLCIEKARGLGFFEISATRSTTRAVIYNGGPYSICNPRSRSVISFPNRFGEWVKLELEYEKLKMLRVLHLVQVDLRESETRIGSLVSLRYLKIEGCKGVTSMLLDSLRSLTNLLTFMYNGHGEVRIPNNMVSNMEQLRCLCLTASRFEGPGLGVGSSRSMQCLRSWAGEWLTKELAMTTVSRLRELRLREIDSQEQLKTISDFVSNPSNYLQILDLSLKEESGLEFDLQWMNLEGCQLLTTLELTGRIHMRHSLLSFAPNLLDLSLFHTRIGEEGNLQKALAQLHQLRRLLLGWRSYDGEKLTMTQLPLLQELTLEGLANLKEWRMEEGDPWQLKHLEIQGCEQLGRIPEGLRGIDTLRRFTVDDMPVSFCERLQRPSGGEDGGICEGRDFHLIRHIPTVIVRDLNGCQYM